MKLKGSFRRVLHAALQAKQFQPQTIPNKAKRIPRKAKHKETDDET